MPDISINPICAQCGIELETDDVFMNVRTRKNDMAIEPREDCLNEAREEGRDEIRREMEDD